MAALAVDQFMGRFLMHVLPTGFMRIRHYGFLANRVKQCCLAQCRDQLQVSPPEPAEPKTVADWMRQLTGVDITRCPRCGAALATEKLASQRHTYPDRPTAITYWDTS